MSTFIQLCLVIAICSCMQLNSVTADNGDCKIVTTEWTATSPNDPNCQRKFQLRHCESKSCNLPGETGKVNITTNQCASSEYMCIQKTYVQHKTLRNRISPVICSWISIQHLLTRLSLLVRLYIYRV